MSKRLKYIGREYSSGSKKRAAMKAQMLMVVRYVADELQPNAPAGG